MTRIDACIDELARVPVLLVASDYDGTIAPIVEDPDAARPLREALVALRMLADLDQTHVALISGRALADLVRFTDLPSAVHLVGSHGSEFEAGFASALSPDQETLRAQVLDALQAIADAAPGLAVETKPASLALHYRRAAPAAQAAALEAVEAGPGGLDGVFVKRGKKVVELSVMPMSKGRALETIRHRCGASAVVFFGDDQTDEEAFATLKGPDLGVKVGPGETRATVRIDSPRDVAQQLARLAERRAAWLAGAQAVPIEAHALLSDQRAVALVTPAGRIPWLCAPRIDAPALFAELLGGAAAGHFSVAAADGSAPVDQAYEGDSHVLVTRWPTFTVTDLLDVSNGHAMQRAGRTDLLRVLEGTGRVRITFAPRIDFGRVPTRLAERPEGLVVEATLDPIVLRAPGVVWQIEREGAHDTAQAEIELGEAPLALELRYGSGSLRPERQEVRDRVRLTRRTWTTWAERLRLPGVEEALVRRSALVLKGLVHGPSGAIAAAATTSLPEHVGGVRNWDYRYCWLRDAAMSAASLARLGSTAEGMAFLDWMCGIVDACASPERLQPLYTVTGGDLVPEAEIAELPGYRASRPVRIGNAAARQVQLDVFGPVVELVALLAEQGAPISAEHWRLVEAMVVAVERRWQEPDHGIWEIRGSPRHHVHSKGMCWLTVERAQVVARHVLERRMPAWAALAERIRSEVLERGFHTGASAFTAAYDGTDLDAATLLVGTSGLVAPSDPRFAQTVAAIERELLEGGTVYRYRADDGLPGREGGFHLCTGWLIQAYLALGRRADAEALFEQLTGFAGALGLLSEQVDPRTRTALGNTPQAYSHIAVIDCAVALSRDGAAAE